MRKTLAAFLAGLTAAKAGKVADGDLVATGWSYRDKTDPWASRYRAVDSQAAPARRLRQINADEPAGD